MTTPAHDSGGDRAKVLSVRFSWDEFEALTAEATRIGVGPSTLARTLVRKGLAMTSQVTPPTEFDTGPPPNLEQRVSALEQLVAQLLTQA